ncbi:MFS transporter [Streptomyces sp. NBC_01003]|uniref:MFS transporter n=1 Tax=Streptomyces sp. NBC_01003 TaxID=2903714 RepID=UPI0038636310|nr:MFS transporter [Streptomyces sp. NBC_01003]
MPAPPSSPSTQKEQLPDPRRWWALCVLGLAQLMILLDSTIVNVALPSMQTELGMADGDRPWVVTSYTVAFGGLLLLAGRIADRAGRKRVFASGLLGFAVASAAAGAAPTAQALFAARAVQGAFAALLAASALALVATTFTDLRERRKAIAVFGALGGAGASLGVVLGGLLTQWFGWRWCLLVNVPIALAALLGTLWTPRDRAQRLTGRIDIAGAVLGCGGLTTVVYGCSQAEAQGWASPGVLGVLLAGAVLLTAFAWWQTRAAAPLLPPRLLRDRRRVASLLAGGALMASQLSVSLYLTYYLQTVLDWSALASGLGFLPISLVTTATATQLGTRLLPRLGPRVMMTAGLCIAACGLFQLTLLDPDSTYAANVLPALITFSIGQGGSFLAIMTGATSRRTPASPRRRSTLRSRWAVPSDLPCSTQWPRARQRPSTAADEPPLCTASPRPSGSPSSCSSWQPSRRPRRPANNLPAYMRTQILCAAILKGSQKGRETEVAALDAEK